MADLAGPAAVRVAHGTQRRGHYVQGAAAVVVQNVSLGREAHRTRTRVHQRQQNIALAGRHQVNVAAGRRG